MLPASRCMRLAKPSCCQRWSVSGKGCVVVGQAYHRLAELGGCLHLEVEFLAVLVFEGDVEDLWWCGHVVCWAAVGLVAVVVCTVDRWWRGLLVVHLC